MSHVELTDPTSDNALAFAVQSLASGANAYRNFVCASIYSTMVDVFGWHNANRIKKDVAVNKVLEAVNKVDACRATKQNWFNAYKATLSTVAKVDHKEVRERLSKVTSLEEAMEILRPWYSQHGVKVNGAVNAKEKDFNDYVKSLESGFVKLQDRNALPKEALTAAFRTILNFAKVNDVAELETMLKAYKKSAGKDALEAASVAETPDEALEAFDEAAGLKAA